MNLADASTKPVTPDTLNFHTSGINGRIVEEDNSYMPGLNRAQERAQEIACRDDEGEDEMMMVIYGLYKQNT